MSDDPLALADAIRAACIAAAMDAYEDAGIQGLCAEGRWEMAVSAMERLDLAPLLHPRARELTMDADASLREHLSRTLDWSDAHAAFDVAVEGIPPSKRGVRPEPLPHSPWELLEHMRIAQSDILAFCRDPAYEELQWPADYWPASPAPPSPEAWEESIAAFRADRQALQELASDRDVDLFAAVPNGTGQTFLREILLVADHTAYHVGQLILVRRLLGVWPVPA